MAKTETAVSKMRVRNAASGMRLLRGCVWRMRCSTDDFGTILRSIAACARVGIAVTGLGVCSAEAGGLVGFSLSGIIRSDSGISFERTANSRSLQAGVDASNFFPHSLFTSLAD